MEKPGPDGGGAIRMAIWVPYEQAEARIAAALAAGGRMVRDESAPSWWTLADAAGNEADIATTKGRDSSGALTMDYEIRVEDARPRQLAVVRGGASRADLGPTILKLLDAVWPVL